MKAAQFFKNLEARRQTRLGLGISIVIEAALAYVIGSLAINSGSLFDYVLAALLIILLIQDMVAFIIKGAKAKNQPEAAAPFTDKTAKKTKATKGKQ